MIIDALYGEIVIDEPLASIVRCPEVQRLRHVFLSNVPSFDIPGIAQVSRFEHSIGTMVLASCVARTLKLDEVSGVTLQTAALLHDAAMPGLGHLMEEAFGLAQRPFNHESHLQSLFQGTVDAGGTAFQIFDGQEVGFRRELERHRLPAGVVGDVLATIKGDGRLGALLNGSIDIDNIDNVARVALHMGLPVRKTLPLELAEALGVSKGQLVVQRTEALALIREWQELRTEVYKRLMFAPSDFAAKTMLVRMLANFIAHGADGGLLEDDWRLTYEEATNKLRTSSSSESRVFKRLYSGDLYTICGMFWVHGVFPGLQSVVQHEGRIGELIGTECWVYGIPDKRFRPVSVSIANGGERFTVGDRPQGWLFGACAPCGKRCSTDKLRILGDYVRKAFEADVTIVDFENWTSKGEVSLFD